MFANVSKQLAVFLVALSTSFGIVRLDFSNENFVSNVDGNFHLVFEDVGEYATGQFADLTITSDDYVGFSPSDNGKFGDENEFGRINMRENAQSNFRFAFTDGETSQAISIDQFSIAFLDIDKSGTTESSGGVETLTVFTPGTYELRQDSLVEATVIPLIGTRFTNTTSNINEGGVGDSASGSALPLDTDLSDAEQLGAIMMNFSNRGIVDFSFEVTQQTESPNSFNGSGRNFLFTGSIVFEDESTVTQALVPEPAAFSLLAGLAAFALIGRRLGRHSR